MIFRRSKLFACLAPWRDEKEVRKKLCLAQSRQDRQGKAYPRVNPADVSVFYGRGSAATTSGRKLERNKKTQPAKGWLLSCPSVSLFVPLNTKIMDGGSDVLFFSLLSVIVAELYN